MDGWGSTSGGLGLEALPQGRLEAGGSACDDDGHPAFVQQDPSGGLEEYGPEALEAHPALRSGVEKFGTCSHEVGGEQGEGQLDLIRGDGVVGPRQPHGRVCPW